MGGRLQLGRRPGRRRLPPPPSAGRSRGVPPHPPPAPKGFFSTPRPFRLTSPPLSCVTASYDGSGSDDGQGVAGGARRSAACPLASPDAGPCRRCSVARLAGCTTRGRPPFPALWATARRSPLLTLPTSPSVFTFPAVYVLRLLFLLSLLPVTAAKVHARPLGRPTPLPPLLVFSPLPPPCRQHSSGRGQRRPRTVRPQWRRPTCQG